MIKVLLVDDHDLIRLGVKRLLLDASNIKVIGEASTGEEAIKMVKKLSPDVVMMDVQMPGIGGLDATRKIIRQNPMVKILVLTGFESELYPSRLLQAGAAGYITKGCQTDEMVRAIRLLHTGGHYIGAEIAQQLAIKRIFSEGKSPLDELSDRELQVMLMVTQGLKVQEISDKLYLSVKTVNSYRYRVFEKIGVDSDVGLTLLAMRLGMLKNV